MDGRDGRMVTSFDYLLSGNSSATKDTHSITMELLTADIKSINLGE